MLLYTLWSGFRASVLTDFAQLVALMAIAVVIIPAVFFAMGGPDQLVAGLGNLTTEQADFSPRKRYSNRVLPFSWRYWRMPLATKPYPSVFSP